MDQQADTRMRSHGLRRLIGNRSSVNRQCILSLKMKSSSSFYQTCCNLVKLASLLQLVDELQQACKINNLQQICDVFGCVVMHRR